MQFPSRPYRPFQKQAIEDIWAGFKTKPRQLVVLPTGSGKSYIITDLIERLARVNYKSILLLNREILVEQFAADMQQLPFGIYAAGLGKKETHHTITAAMIQSCYREKFEDVKVIFVDETHNIGEDDGMYQTFLANHPTAKIVGFTATPYDKRGYIFGSDKFYPRKDFFRSMEYMIAEGHLVPPVSRVVFSQQFDTTKLRMGGEDYILEELNALVSDKRKAQDQVKDALSRVVDRKKVLWMCLNIEHAEMIMKEIHRYEDCSIIHSKQSKGASAAHLEQFETGSVRHMVSVAKISEGYDYRPADALVLLRPTRSPKLYVQTVGRILRTHPGKTNGLFLDYGEVMKNLGSVFDPHVERDKKSRASIENRTSVFLSSGIRVCPACFLAVNIKVKLCECGHEFRDDVDKNLQRKASYDDVQTNAREITIDDVEISHYMSKAGNACVRVDYRSGLMRHSQFFSAHPYSWSKGVKILKQLTGWDFSSHQECLDAADELMAENIPKSIMVKRNGKYDEITQIIFAETSDSAIQAPT